MVKKYFIVFLLMAVFGSAAIAANPVVPNTPYPYYMNFLPFYWVKGTVKKEGQVVANRIVTVYFDDIKKEATGLTDANGNYAINIYRLNYFFDTAISFSDNYNIAVYKGTDNYGKNAEIINFDSKVGFITKNIVLAQGEGPGPKDEIIDTGRIRMTWIEKDTPDTAKLHWAYDVNGPTAVKIYAKSGGEFTRTPVDYTFVADVPPAIMEYQISGANAKGTNYYRVIPEPLLVNTDVLSDANNSITVAQVTIPINKAENFVGCSLYTTSAKGAVNYFHVDKSLNNILSGQLSEGSSIYSFNMADPDYSKRYLEKTTYLNGSFGNPPPFGFDLSKGYLVYRSLDDATDRNLVFVGIIKNTDFKGEIDTAYNLISSPFTKKYLLSNFGFGTSPVDGDAFYYWSQKGSYLEKVFRNNGKWDPEHNVVFEKGYWYYKTIETDPNKPKKFNWELSKP
ncbi:MAG: hypothetical protein FD145_928 [Candidatus Saganbacteria bacterium]|uniref:Carboxypeptidase regulatory-like domain-containing protein n=1 Tax=Candidatus Saganbacteria bacterium TaxID=2575572 RepID=A0A833L0V8_UNCSA|nr:MAG: hypothetical protein FD145_928 [Candidatus Saganbacteria bacterium]